MGRVSNAKLLSPAKLQFVEETIRHHNYSQLDVIVATLREAGIGISRSSVQRYKKKLEQRDGMTFQNPDHNLVLIVNRATGHTKIIFTEASFAQIVKVVSKVNEAAS